MVEEYHYGDDYWKSKAERDKKKARMTSQELEALERTWKAKIAENEKRIEAMAKLKKAKELKDDESVEAWEAKLKELGMPDELPMEVWSEMDDSATPDRAVRIYLDSRGMRGYSGGAQDGEHLQAAQAVSRRFGISRGAAEQMIEDLVSGVSMN